jgi:hypothetical protein
MKRALALTALLASLGGCVVSPAEPGYGYGQPAYPGGGAYYDDSSNIYPGYAYNNGSPSLIVEGSAMPLTLYEGGWGYWDRGRHWHHAPDQVEHNLEHRHAGGRPPGPPPQAGHAEGPRFEGSPSQRQDWHHSDGAGRYGAAPPPRAASPVAMPGPGPGGPDNERRHGDHHDDHQGGHQGDHQGDHQRHDRSCPGDRNC